MDTSQDNWRERYDNAWKFGVDDVQRKANVKAFIDKELERVREDGIIAHERVLSLLEGRFEAGKSEAFSLVKEVVVELENNLPSGYAEGKLKAVKAFSKALLSTLEGK